MCSLFVFCGAFATKSRAATYVVNTTADTHDRICDGSNCTLREAITAANATSGADTHC